MNFESFGSYIVLAHGKVNTYTQETVIRKVRKKEAKKRNGLQNKSGKANLGRSAGEIRGTAERW